MTKDEKAKELMREALIESFNKDVPFNTILGLEINSTFETSEVRMKMKPELVGNVFHKVLHGGVISAVLDATGAIVAIVNASQKLMGKSPEDFKKRLFGISTIDLRIDYLSPGFGEEFIAKAHLIRRGAKVAVVGMELKNEKDDLIAIGRATYLVG
ncbi:MAG: thioesterase family protein [Pseudomonadota bacterium]